MRHWLNKVVTAGLLCWGANCPVSAQTPPSAAEITSYRGIHAAAARGDLVELRNLIRQKGDLEVRDDHGRTALHVAVHRGHHEAVQELARAGANMTALDSRRYDVITIAAVKNDVEMVKLAISLGSDPRAITSPYDGTALIAAAHLGHADVVEALIAAKAPLDHVNNLGWTAAIEAVILGDGGTRHQATLKALVDGGANMAIADREGRTPLDHAKMRGFHKMQEILLLAPRQ